MKKLLIAWLLGMFGAGVASAQYTFVDLHPSPGDSTSATSIYNSMIAGNYEFWDGMAGGMAWNASTGTEYFNNSVSEAFATNGTLVGGVIGNFGGIWNPVSNTTTLFNANSRVLGMSGNQQVGRDSAGAKMWHGTAASMVALPSLVGLVATQANATDGTFQVGFGGFVSTGYTPHAMLWQGTGGIPVDLHPPAFRSSEALGVSNGYQVGYAESQFGAPYYGYEIAMMWSSTAASAVSLHPNGCTYSYATGISGNQQVGWAHFTLTGQNRALLWNGSANNYLDLHTFLPSGYVNSYANSIDPLTGDIVGVVETTDGYTHAALWRNTANANQPPVLSPIGDRATDELNPLTITPIASDPDSGQTLTYSLTGTPSGMTINPTTGIIDWTPSEAQGPGSYPITITVTDNGTPAASDSETITVTVNEVNLPPTINNLPEDLSIDEGQEFSLALTGLDEDIPTQTLTFSLVTGPSGLTVSPSGQMSWTPSEAQGGAQYPVTVRLSDGVTSVQAVCTISVVEQNGDPQFQPIPPITVNEGDIVNFTLVATDPDLPAQTLTYFADNAPGASVNSQTGEVSWETQETDGPGTHTLSFSVSDGDYGNDTIDVVVHVLEVNEPPSMGGIGDQEVEELTELSFTVDAQESDIPAQALTYSLAGPPAGAQINTDTGEFAWTPTAEQGPGEYTFDVRVSDGVDMISETITITVTERNAPPELTWPQNHRVQTGTELALDIDATDSDLPNDLLTFSLENGPAGATIDSQTGAFSWTPTKEGTTIVQVRVTDIAGLSDSRLFSVTAGSLGTEGRAWGGNPYGQLGDGTTTSRLVPTPASGLAGVVAVSGGINHTLALLSDGTVRAWGDNSWGQLGDGTTTNRLVPAPVSGLTGVVAVSGGGYHCLALLSDGTVLAWGYNVFGQLGDGTTTNRLVPAPVSSLTGVVAVSGGVYHSLALLTDGTVRAWGLNSYGQLGDGTATPGLVPTPVSGLAGVVAVAGGYSHSLALLTDGTVRAWGLNNYGQLGNGTTATCLVPTPVSGLTGVVAVAGGDRHSLALLSDGSVNSWGDNSFGQLGDGTTTNRLIPTPVSGLTGVIAVSGGYRHGLALLSDGTVRAWGDNGIGQLGDGTTTNRLIPTPVSGLTGVVAVSGGYLHSLAIIKVPPATNAGADVSIPVPHDGSPTTNTASVTLSGSGTPNPNNDTFTYEWKEGATVVGNAVSMNVTRPVGTYTFTLTVTGSNGASGTDDVTLTVTPEQNQGPAANAGPDKTYAVPHDGNPLTNLTTFTLGGSGTDPDSDTLGFAWSQGATNVGNSASVTVQRPAGVHSFLLTVTDPYGGSGNDSVVITVTPEPNAPPKAVPDQFTIKKNTTAILPVLKNDTDADGDPLTLVSIGSFGLNVSVQGNQVRYIPATNFLGNVTFTYTMRDPYGVTSSTTVKVKVSNAGASGYTP